MKNTRLPSKRLQVLPVSLLLLGLTACDRGNAVAVPEALPLTGATAEAGDATAAVSTRGSADDTIVATTADAMNSQTASTADMMTNGSQIADTTKAAGDTTTSTANTSTSTTMTGSTTAGNTTTNTGSTTTTTTGNTATNTGSTTTTTTVHAIADGDYTLVSRQSNRCLDNPSSSLSAGTRFQIWDCNNSAAQIYTITWVKDNYFKIINAASKLAVQVADDVPVQYSWVTQGAYTGRNGQLFSIDKRSDGYYVLHSMGTNFAIDVTGAVTDNGTKIQMYPDNGYLNESWTLQKR